MSYRPRYRSMVSTVPLAALVLLIALAGCGSGQLYRAG